MTNTQRSQKIDVNLEDKTFEVEYDYEPEEKEVRYDSDMSGHPGSPAEVLINKVTYNDEDWTDFIFEYIGFERMEQEVWEYIERNNDY